MNALDAAIARRKFLRRPSGTPAKHEHAWLQVDAGWRCLTAYCPVAREHEFPISDAWLAVIVEIEANARAVEAK